MNCEKLSKLAVNQLLGKFLEDKDEKEKLEECFTVHDSKKKNILKSNNQFFNFIDLLLKSESSISDLVKLDNYLKNYENFLAKSARILGFLKVNNQARASNLIKEVIKKDISYYILNSEKVIWDFDNSRDYLLKVLRLIQKKIKNQRIFDLFKFYIYANSSGSLQDAIDDEFDIRKGLIYLNKQFESHNYGREYLFTWGPKIYEESSDFSYRNFLERYLKHQSFEKLNLSTMLFFRNGPLNNKKTKKSFKILDSYFKEKETYNLFLIQQILSGDYFRDALKGSLNENKNLLHLSSLSGQRKFYHQLKNMNLKVGLIHLISLGDYPEDDIKKLVQYGK